MSTILKVIFLSGARPALPMGVAPESMGKCLLLGIDSSCTTRWRTWLYFWAQPLFLSTPIGGLNEIHVLPMGVGSTRVAESSWVYKPLYIYRIEWNFHAFSLFQILRDQRDTIFSSSNILYMDIGKCGWFIWRIRYQLIALVENPDKPTSNSHPRTWIRDTGVIQNVPL
jgi:hypothetical protein